MLGIVDIKGWQSVIKLSSGQQIDTKENDYGIIRKILSDHPYPGDANDDSIDWVKETAQKVVDLHDPDWMHISYTQPLYIETYMPYNPIESQERQKRILDDIFNFSQKNNFEPIIIMTGGYVPLIGEITQPETEGLLESWVWGASVAGISQSDENDKSILLSHPHIKHVIDKNDILDSHPNLHPNFIYNLPDYIVIAKEGYAFKGIKSYEGEIFMADVYTDNIPVYSDIGMPKHIRDVRDIMENSLDDGKKVLLAIIEGYNINDIPQGFKLCKNMDEWYSYRGMDLYLALHTGKPFYETEFPPVFSRSIPKQKRTNYPLSGFFDSLPENSIGAKKGIRSAAVSSRSMIIHMIANSDITVECYSRERSDMGLLAAFKPEKMNRM